MHGWVCWTAIVVILIIGLYWIRYNHSKRFNLTSYIVYLLLRDEIRNDHKAKLQEWLIKTEAKDASALFLLTEGALEDMADSLAKAETGSILASRAMLWNYKKGKP